MLRRYGQLAAIGLTGVSLACCGVCWQERLVGDRRAEGQAGRQSPFASPTVLAKGAPIHGANGIRFDRDNRLHVASVLGNEIMVMDPETGEVISTIGANAGVVGPDDIAFGPDGSLYWTSFSTGEVGRIAPDGTRSGLVVGLGVNGIAVSPTGRLFVSVVFMGDALYELDAELEVPARLIAERPGFINGMDWGPDGMLYGAVWTRGEIARINVDTGVISAAAVGFNVPSAVKFDSSGRLCALEQVTGDVYEVGLADGRKTLIADLAPGLDNLAFDRDDRLFVSDGQDGRVVEILGDGGTRTVSDGGMIAPGGVAVLGGVEGEDGPGGDAVMVADFWTLRRLDPLAGSETACYRHCIGERGGITSPFTVSADGANLIVTSWHSKGAVQVIDPASGRVLQEYRDVDEPINAVRFQGDVVVCERGTGSVVRLSADQPSKRTVLASGLGLPAGLAATERDLWVSDWATGRVLEVVTGGRVRGRPRVLAEDLAYPEGLAVCGDGSLLVVEAEAGRLTRIDPRSGEVTTVWDGLAPCLQGDHPTWIFNGVAVGASGTIYLTSDAANAVYRIDVEE
ncbi:MAG: hypothetical protein WAW06_05360 [bacterium]